MHPNIPSHDVRTIFNHIVKAKRVTGVRCQVILTIHVTPLLPLLYSPLFSIFHYFPPLFQFSFPFFHPIYTLLSPSFHFLASRPVRLFGQPGKYHRGQAVAPLAKAIVLTT